jgi:hypothetical protein
LVVPWPKADAGGFQLRRAWLRPVECTVFIGPVPRRVAAASQFQRAPVDVLQRIDLGHVDVLVDLVDAGVDRAELDDLRADLGDEAAVAGAAGGRELGLEPVSAWMAPAPRRPVRRAWSGRAGRRPSRPAS